MMHHFFDRSTMAWSKNTFSFSFCPYSFIHKMNSVEFKSATFPNAGSRHLLDDSVMESHSPTRGQAESSTLSSGISLGKTLGLGRYAFLPIRYYHDTWVPIRYILWYLSIAILQVLRFDIPIYRDFKKTKNGYDVIFVVFFCLPFLK